MPEVITISDHLKNLKDAKALPNVFTEHGTIMAAKNRQSFTHWYHKLKE
jgi:hypothetical protein